MTADEIYASLCEAFLDKSGLTAGCSAELSVRFYAVAAQIEALYSECVWVREQCFPQTASGTYLDYHAELRGLERRAAAQAEGTIRFLTASESALDLTIGAGTVCMTAGGTCFETTEDVTLSAGETYADAPAQAAEGGTAGNVEAGTILVLSAPPVGIAACTNPEAFSGGTDEEDDETLRARVLDAYANLNNGTNTAYYEQAALSFSGVAAAQVLGRYRGIGTVDVILASEDGVPDDDLIDEVQAYFDEQREIAVDVLVRAPETVPVDVTVLLQVSEQADFDTVEEEVGEILNEYFTGALLGSGVLTAKLGALVFAADGVENLRITAPAEDLSASNGVLPVLGTLTITEWSGTA